MAGVIILCGLGTWQLKRLAWKTGIIKSLNAAYNNPETLPLTPESLSTQDFVYGSVTGTFIPDKALLLGPRIQDGEIGNHLIVPLITSANTSTLINLGWTSEPLSSFQLPTAKIQISGLARKPDWNSFTPDNNPAEDKWYKGDITEIATLKNIENPASYMLYADKTSIKIENNLPNNPRWEPQNDHAGYAIFWFSMALALLVIYWLRFVKSPDAG
jgi:surfeit locus 1 family protein